MELGLVVLDGWGLNPDPIRDAVAAAETPTVDRLRERGASAQLTTHGPAVGLPDGQMGNSEVGHLTIGAGRVVRQESARITDAIARWRGETAAADDPPIDENPAITAAVEYARTNDGRLHLLGLVSDGGVHSYQSHVHGLVELAAEHGLEAVTHAFTDGRDTPPRSAVGYLEDLRKCTENCDTGTVATVSGRYYAMDRDENWERTRRVYDAIVDREAEHVASDPVDALERAYDRGTTDEFLPPTLIEGGPALADGDAAVFVNFRADRARQLAHLLAGRRAVDPPAIKLVTMTTYDQRLDVPVAFPPRQPAKTLGAVLADRGYSQLRIAETEKYAHVTYFFNGGRERTFPGERREIVPSPDVPTYDRQPEMSAPAVTDRAIAVIESDDPDVVVLNYANPDMVGHTGEYEAAIAACEAVDRQLDRLAGAIVDAGGDLLVTADHGNADEMGTPEAPHTAHTTNPTPFVYRSATGQDGRARDGGLSDLAPTVLAALGEPRPDEMTGRPLVSR